MSTDSAMSDVPGRGHPPPFPPPVPGPGPPIVTVSTVGGKPLSNAFGERLTINGHLYAIHYKLVFKVASAAVISGVSVDTYEALLMNEVVSDETAMQPIPDSKIVFKQTARRASAGMFVMESGTVTGVLDIFDNDAARQWTIVARAKGMSGASVPTTLAVQCLRLHVDGGIGPLQP